MGEVGIDFLLGGGHVAEELRLLAGAWVEPKKGKFAMVVDFGKEKEGRRVPFRAGRPRCTRVILLSGARWQRKNGGGRKKSYTQRHESTKATQAKEASHRRAGLCGYLQPL